MKLGFIFYGRKLSYLIFDDTLKLYFKEYNVLSREMGRLLPFIEVRASDIKYLEENLKNSGYTEILSVEEAKTIFGK